MTTTTKTTELGTRVEAGDDDAYSLWCSAWGDELTELGGWSVGREVEGGDTADDYDTGEILAVRRAEPGGDEDVAEVLVGWSNGAQTWQTTNGLRDVGTSVPE